MQNQVLEKIEQIKEKFGDHPQCYLVAVVLSTNFKGHIWYDHNHCITEIDGDFYDRKGIVDIEAVENGNYLPINEYGVDSELELMIAMGRYIQQNVKTE